MPQPRRSFLLWVSVFIYTSFLLPLLWLWLCITAWIVSCSAGCDSINRKANNAVVVATGKKSQKGMVGSVGEVEKQLMER